MSVSLRLPPARPLRDNLVPACHSLSCAPCPRSLLPNRLYPEERVAMKDPAEALLEDGEWKKSDMFFEYRVQEGDEVAQCCVCAHSLLACQRTI